MQSDAFDFIALAIGIVATLQPAALVLFSTQRLPQPCQLYNLVAVAFTAIFITVMYIATFKTLVHESWYQADYSDESHVSSRVSHVPCYPLCHVSHVLV